MLFDALVWGVAAPALAALALMLGAGRGVGVWRDKLRTLAPAAAIWVAYLGLVGWPAIPPREAMQLLPWFLLAPLLGARPWFLALVAAALPAALAWRMWARDPLAVLVALAPVWVLGLPLVFFQARLAARAGAGLGLSLGWAITAAASGGVFFLAHSAKLAQLSGAAAAAAGALFLLSLRRRGGLSVGAPAVAGIMGVMALSQLGLLSVARLYAYPELPLWPQTLGLLLLPAAAIWGTTAAFHSRSPTATATAPPGG